MTSCRLQVRSLDIRLSFGQSAAVSLAYWTALHALCWLLTDQWRPDSFRQSTGKLKAYLRQEPGPDIYGVSAGTVGVAPSFVQRSLLILLERMGPYLAERISSSARAQSDSDNAALHTLRDTPAAQPQEQPVADSTDASDNPPSGAAQYQCQNVQPALRCTFLRCIRRWSAPLRPMSHIEAVLIRTAYNNCMVAAHSQSIPGGNN